MSAGLATLDIVHEEQCYGALESAGAALEKGLLAAASDAGVPLTINRVGSMITPFFVKVAGQPVENYDQAIASNTQAYATFFHAMLDNGVFLPPSQFESWFISTAHDQRALNATIEAARSAFAEVASRVR